MCGFLKCIVTISSTGWHDFYQLLVTKLFFMKTNTNLRHSGNPQDKKMNHRPENKDNLDSREREEQSKKGDDITHNKKETHGEPKKK